MKKYLVLLISFGLLFVTTVYFTVSITKDLDKYHDKKEQIAEELNFEKRMMDASSYLTDFFGIGESFEDLEIRLESEASAYYDSASKKGLYLGLVVFVYMIINVLFYRKKRHRLQVMGLIMVSSAIVFLYLGLQSPFLEIIAYNYDLEVHALGVTYTYDGRVYYMYQNKSILQLISMLYNGGNFLVAMCLLLFSIIFPIVKIFTSIVVFVSPHSKYAENAVAVINKIGKWSMADVFVAAVFLAYFSFANMNVAVDTGSKTLIGTYFFLAFVVLSIGSGVFLKKVIKLDPEEKDL